MVLYFSFFPYKILGRQLEIQKKRKSERENFCQNELQAMTIIKVVFIMTFVPSLPSFKRNLYLPSFERNL